MLNIKSIQTFFSSLLLLITLISFSGFTSASSSNEKPQTELVVSNTSTNQVTTKPFKFLKRSSKNTTFNQYTTFCFKWLLNTHQYNFNITFKSQKETFLQFNKHLLLDQNLIAKISSNDYQSNLVK